MKLNIKVGWFCPVDINNCLKNKLYQEKIAKVHIYEIHTNLQTITTIYV